MSAVGWVGLGKLGLPCARVLAAYGHDVLGYDADPLAVTQRMLGRDPGEPQPDLVLPLAASVAEVVTHADVVFVAVPTPHAPAYGGETPAPHLRRDFEYGYLHDACRAVCRAANEQGRDTTLVVVSTVLPGTCDRLVRPLLGEHVRLVYNPFFIAMGTTVADFLNPEFVLLGTDREADTKPVREVYAPLHDRPAAVMSVASAELTKVAYNTFISAKLVFANTLMEICHATGADVDEVTGALAMATDRVISARYLTAGMGDGGACHPRDLIAMSWLAQRLDLSYDLLGELATAREAQTTWLADLVRSWCAQTGLRPFVLGKAYKPGSALTYGSPALLLAGMLGCESWDPYLDGRSDEVLADPHVYVIGTRHNEFEHYPFPAGSVVIDPWAYIPDADGITVVRVGRKS